MKDINISILGFDLIRRNVPENVEELNQLAKDEEMAYNLAMDYWKFHSDYSKLRPAIAAAVEKASGVARFKHPEVTTRGERTVYDESEKDYLERVQQMIEDGELENPDFDARALAATAQEGVDSVTVSFEKAVRGMGAGSEPAKKWLAYYDEAVAQDVLEDKIAAINKSTYYTGTELDADDDDIRVKFALACKEIIVKKTKEISTI